MKDAISINEDYTVAKFEPDERAFGEIAKEGFRSVVSLQTHEEEQKVPPGRERRLAEAAGLMFYHQPVSSKSLSEEAVDRFRREVEKLPKPVLLHCASGKRAGAMTMMHLGSSQGMTGAELVEKAGSMGFPCDAPELERFVRGYVDRHRET